MTNKYKKQIIIGLIAILVSAIAVPVIFQANSVGAFGIPGIPTPTIQTLDIPGSLWRVLDKAFTTAVDVSFRNQLNKFLNNFAYNTAVKIATGKPGQKPLFIDVGKALKEAGDQAVGQFAAELLISTSGGGKCQYTGSECIGDNDCPYIARAEEEHANYFRSNPTFTPPYQYAGNYNFIVLGNNEAEAEPVFNELTSIGWIVGGNIRDKCQVQANAKFAGIDICRIDSPAAEVVIKTVALDVQTQPAPRCTISRLKENFEDLKNIDTGGLVRVTDIFNSRSNELGVILNLTAASQERRSASIKQQEVEALVNEGFEANKEPVTDTTKTPAAFVKEAGLEAFVKNPIKGLTTRTGSLVADAVGVFINTLASKMLEQIFDKGFTPDASGILQGRFFGGLSGIAAAKLKFAEILKLKDIKSRERDSSALLTELSPIGCDESDKQLGISSVTDPDAFRQVRNCVIDDLFRQAIQDKLTVKQALEQDLLSSQKAFGGRIGESGSFKALAGSCLDGCDPEVYSLRSIQVLRSLSVVPVGWELAARYIQDILSAEDFPGKTKFSLAELLASYSDATSPFYRLVDPNWQLKAPIAYKEIRGPGDRIIVELTPQTEADEEEQNRIIQRGEESADLQTCVSENANGGCDYYGYCTEQRPIWRITGDTCEERYNTCQAFTRGGDNARVAYLARTTDGAACEASNAGCRRYSLQKDPLSGAWLDGQGNNIFIDRGAPSCDASKAGCSEFLRLLDISSDSLSAPAVLQAIQGVQAAGGETADYQDFARIEKLYLRAARVDCSSSQDFDNNGLLDDNVACQLFTPTSFRGPDVPGVITPATVDTNGVITAYNDECPAECVGFQPYDELAANPLYPVARQVDFIAKTARQCSASQVGCTEFTNLNEVAQGGEGLRYYTQLRACLPENDGSLEQYFTWEGSSETGFQLRSWLLQGGGPGGGPRHTGDSDYNLCTAAIYNLPPDDPARNPDCREYIDVNLDRYYRLGSRVVIGSSQCEPLRRSLTDVNNDGSINDTDCALGGGDPQGNGCIHYALPSGSRSCSQSGVGCRQYQGYGGGNTRQIVFDTFESGSSSGWSGGTVSNESLFLNGHSLYVQGGVFDDIRKSVTLTENRQYVFSLWAKGSASLDISLVGVTFGLPLGSITLTSDWQQYSLGPVSVPEGTSIASLHIDGFGSGEGYLDNILLAESGDLYRISNSWTTPAICIAPESQLFCEAYRNQARENKYLKSFTRLCQSEFIGCEALVATQNFDLASGATYAGGASALDDVSVPGDELVYLVNNERYYCQAGDAGCAEVGLRTLKRDNTASFTSQFRVLDPDAYLTSLCFAEHELCEEYSPLGSSGGFPQSFKNPQDRTCEYRSNVRIGDRVYTGWFKTGANPVTISDICQEGSVPNHESNAPVCNFNYATGLFEDMNTIVPIYNDARYLSPGVGCYVYQCPANQSSCSEFQDPVSPENCDILLPPGAEGACDYYYFLRDSLASGQSSCQGQINPNENCAGFYETSRGPDSKYLRADCQVDCPLVLSCYDPANDSYSGTCRSGAECASGLCRGVPVTESPDCTLDAQQLDPSSKPGCVF